MMSLLVLLLAVLPSNDGVFAFAPPSKSCLNRARSSSSPHNKPSPSPLPLVSFDVSSLISDAADAVAAAATSSSSAAAAAAVEDGGKSSSSFTPTYSNASYYTTLALYALSFPGLWSQIKRSTTAKVKRKTYVR